MENTEVEKRGRGRPRIYNYPNEIVCTITGKSIKTNPVQFKKQLEKSGLTQEEYIKAFVSREGKKTLKPVKVKKEKKLKPMVEYIVEQTEKLDKEGKISPERLAMLNKYFPKNKT